MGPDLEEAQSQSSDYIDVKKFLKRKNLKPEQET